MTLPVQGPQVIKHIPPQGTIDPGRVGQVVDGIAGVAELDPRVFARKEPGIPQPAVERLSVAGASARGQHHVGGQIPVERPQAVGEPGADAGPAGKLGARLEKGNSRVVIDRLGVHGPHQA